MMRYFLIVAFMIFPQTVFALQSKTIPYDDITDTDYELDNDLTIEDATPHLRLTDTDGSSDDFEIYADSNKFILSNVTDGLEVFIVDANNNVRFPRLTSCDTIDTDAQGVLACGTDATGAGGGDPVLVNTVAIADASGVDLTTGTSVSVTLDAGVSPDTATFDVRDDTIDGTELADTITLDAALTLSGNSVAISAAVPQFDLVDSTAGDDDFEFYADNDRLRIVNKTTGVQLLASNNDDLVSARNLDLSAGGLQIPSNIGPSLTANGEIGIDTTDDQFLYVGTGSAIRIIPYTQEVCRRIDNVSAADDDIDIWMANEAVTVTEVGCRYRGTGTTVATFALQDAAGNAMTHSAPTCATTSTAATYQFVTAAGSLTAGEGLMFDTTNTPSPTTDDYLLCWRYTVDQQ